MIDLSLRGASGTAYKALQAACGLRGHRENIIVT